ncbi:MAG: glycoside hydrolase family 140 protein [Cyclobacteriaceae bacterium]|nr:glycoside hydrolase family 140 protein [Cyclobacteriaceae bacterium HetDA_MAG_MS6]
MKILSIYSKLVQTGRCGLLLLSLLCSLPSYSQLSISPDGRYIVDAQGDPFFWLGDTAWELFHRLDKEESMLYLKNRAAKGFNVVQAVALAELEGLTVPNREGHLPLHDQDPSKPNEEYFQHLDFVIEQAEQLGIYVALLPTWGDKFNKKWGVGPVVFTPKNAKDYGRFIANRYKDRKIVWVLGGDRNPENEEQKEIVLSMAKAIYKVVGDTQLITYHPQGGSSSAKFFEGEKWLDVNLFQSGHWAKDYPNFKHTETGYALNPPMPIIDGEPCYEDHPINWKPDNGWYDEFDTRRAGYWSLLSGAAGHTYGNHNIWQMWTPERSPISLARTHWAQALDYAGAFQAGYTKMFFESRPWHLLRPDQSMILSPSLDTLSIGHTCRAAVAKDKSFAFAYTPYGDSLQLDLSSFELAQLQGYWFNPRIGKSIDLGKVTPAKSVTFDPPGDVEEGNDWVLVLDDPSSGFVRPEIADYQK